MGQKVTAATSLHCGYITKELLTHLLEVCAPRGLYTEKLPVWQGIPDKIPPYMINADGAAKEWMAEDLDDQYFHRHIYPVFPGEEISAESDPLFFPQQNRRGALEKSGVPRQFYVSAFFSSYCPRRQKAG
ncbi:MAG: hypothetical protein IJ412_10465 [Oscillospiraceae bacterium]|nr:hypothetical protein [Oscillospiraceae bacterium]